MKATGLLSIKQLAELLGMSTDTIRRAARKRLLPYTREGTAYRFDWRNGRRAMEARAKEMRNRRSTRASAPDGESRPREAGLPPVGNTGALATGIVTGVLFIR